MWTSIRSNHPRLTQKRSLNVADGPDGFKAWSAVSILEVLDKKYGCSARSVPNTLNPLDVTSLPHQVRLSSCNKRTKCNEACPKRAEGPNLIQNVHFGLLIHRDSSYSIPWGPSKDSNLGCLACLPPDLSILLNPCTCSMKPCTVSCWVDMAGREEH